MTVYDPHSDAGEPDHGAPSGDPNAAAHPHSEIAEADERTHLNGAAAPLARLGLLGGGACLAVGILFAFLAGFFGGGSGGAWGGLKYVMNGYLLAFIYAVSLGIGSLFFVILQFIYRAGWGVNVRRIPETMAGILPFTLLLGLPILISILAGIGTPYIWAQWSPKVVVEEYSQGFDAKGPTAGVSDKLSAFAQTAVPGPGGTHVAGGGLEAGEKQVAEAHGEARGEAHGEHLKEYDEAVAQKRAYLNPIFATIRLLAYGAFFGLVGRNYWKTSVRQDQTGDWQLTRRLEIFSAPGLLMLAFITTFFAFDLLMSLDPHWFSTIFGIYFWAGSAVGGFAAIILALNLLQREGFLTESVSVEHYHDLGKFLFAGVFFWGYVAFSQYMLQWYAALPEETHWFLRRGGTTVSAEMTGWTAVILAILFGHLLIPFAGLLSRHVKRSKGFLTFWAVWLLLFHWIDLWWLIMPEGEFGGMTWVLPEILMTAGLLGIVLWRFLTALNENSLRPVQDPRVEESFAFMNV